MRLINVRWLTVQSMAARCLAVLCLLIPATACSLFSSYDPDAQQQPQAQAQAEPEPEEQNTSSSSWFGRKQPVQPKPLLITPEDAAEIGYRLGWASPINLREQQAITSVTVLGDVVIVIEDPQNTVTALRTDNGELMWKVALGSDLENLFKPTRDGKRLFIHSESRFFTLDVRNGQVTAVANLLTTVGAPGVYSEQFGLVFMSGVNGLVFAHSVDNNFPRWRYMMANRISNSPVVAGQDVFVVDTGGTYAMIEANSGRPLWRNHTLGPVNTAPGVQDSEVIVASADGKLYALNRSTGRDTWQYLGGEQPLNASPAVLGRLIIQPLQPNNGLVAIDAINGEELWRSSINATPVLTRQQDMLLHTDRSLVSIDLNDGSLLVQAPTLKLQTVVPAGDDGSIVLVSPNGRLMRLSPK